MQEDVPIQDYDDGNSLNELATNKTETISVTIRRGSRSTKFPSPLKREGTFDSRLSKFDKQSSGESLLRSKLSDHTVEKFSLPSLVREGEGGLSTQSLPKTVRKSDFGTRSGVQTGLSKKSLIQSETIPSTCTADHVTVIPTGFDQSSAVSGLSTFTKGTTPSKSTNDLDSKFESETATLELSLASKHSHTTRLVSASKSTKTSDHAVALSDSFRTALGSDRFGNTEDHREPVRRPKAGHHRERMLQEKHSVPSDEQSVSSYRPESGKKFIKTGTSTWNTLTLDIRVISIKKCN